ncbi:MAG: TrkA family potassium uptake protein [bacterium]|nr:TrkA family potassium uptake protein [bacterium]
MYIIVIGCGRVGAELSQVLSSEGHNVVVIDKNGTAFVQLEEGFNGMTIHGSGFDEGTLKEAGIEKADAVACVTDKDNVNIVSAQVAKKVFGVKRVIARIYDPKKEETYDELGLDVIGGTSLVARLIKEHLTSPHPIHRVAGGKAEVIEIDINDEMDGDFIEKIEKKRKTKVFAVISEEGIFVPTKEMIPKKGSVLIAINKREME